VDTGGLPTLTRRQVREFHQAVWDVRAQFDQYAVFVARRVHARADLNRQARETAHPKLKCY